MKANQYQSPTRSIKPTLFVFKPKSVLRYIAVTKVLRSRATRRCFSGASFAEKNRQQTRYDKHYGRRLRRDTFPGDF